MIRFFNILVWFLVSLLWTSSVWAARVQVRLYPQVALDAGAVTLGMVGQVQSDDAQMQQRLESLVIGDVVEGMVDSSIGVYEVNRALARATIEPASVDVYGAMRCRLMLAPGDGIEQIEAVEYEAADQEDKAVETETVRDQLDLFIAKESGFTASRLKIQWRQRDRDGVLDRAYVDGRFTFKPRSTIGPGKIQVDVIDRQERDGHKMYRVRGQIYYLCESVVTCRELMPGAVIGPGDVKLLSRRVDDLRDVGLEDPALVLGQEVARSIPANAVVQSRMIKKVELVGRDDVVNVKYNDGRVVLSLQARAKESGCLGDVIEVYDLFNKRHFQGRIVGAGEVRVLRAEM